MVTHMILVRLKEETTEEQKTALVDALKALKDIPGVVTCTAGANVSARNDGYTVGCAMIFDTQASLDAYGPHPLHQKMVQENLRPNMLNVSFCDYAD